jgi:TPR repeat protein
MSNEELIVIEEIEEILKQLYPVWGNNEKFNKIIEDNYEKYLIIKSIKCCFLETESGQKELYKKTFQEIKDFNIESENNMYNVISKLIIPIENVDKKELKSILEDLKKYKNHTLVQFYLGKIYINLENTKKSEKYLKLASENNHRGGFTNLGYLYKIIDKNIEKAIKCYKKGAKLGCPVAMYNLGKFNKIKIFIGITFNDNKEYEKSEKYFKLAIEENYEDAFQSLG